MKIKVLDNACIPYRAHTADAGLDLKAREDIKVLPHQTVKVPLGVQVAIPEGYVGLLFPRSSMGKTGLRMTNSVGVIDSGYRGEVCAMYQNTLPVPYPIIKGARVAQLVILPLADLGIELVDELDDTERGEGGFGSSGIN